MHFNHSPFRRFRCPFRDKSGVVLLLTILLLLNSCLGQIQSPPVERPQPQDAQDVLFFHAEEIYRSGASDQALGLYSRYLGQYPQGRHAAIASLRIGHIYQSQGDLGPAQAFYRNVIEKFPNSDADPQARLALIDLFIQDKKATEAIDLAVPMLDMDLNREMRLALLERMVHLSKIVQDPSLTVLYANMLFQLSTDPHKEQWYTLLVESIRELDKPGIEMVWDRLEDPWLRSFLMYRYAVIQTMAENYDDALDLLVAFHQTYPEHPYTSDALQLTEVVKQRLAFTPFTVGCLVPLTGSYKTYGQRMLNAVQMALIGMQSGETPLPIKLVVKDSASDDLHAVEAVRQLAQAGVGAIIGPIITSQAAAREAQRLNIPIVTFTQKTDITKAGDFVFRHFITPNNQVKTLVEFFIGELNLRHFAVMYPREAYGNTFMNLFWDELVKQGGQMVGVESYDPKQTDFADTIKKLIGTYYPIPEELQAKPMVQVEENPYYQAAPQSVDTLEDVLPDPVTRLTGMFFQDPDQDRIKGPAVGRRRQEKIENPIVDFDVLFIPDAPKVTGLILPQLAYHDVKNIYTAGTNLWHSQQLINMTQQYAQNAVMVDGFYKDSQSQIVQNFVEQFEAIYGESPGLMEAFAFDTANIIFGLLSHSQIELRHQLRNAMKQLFYTDGVTGTTAFGPDGEAIKRLSLLRVKGDRFVEINHP